MQVCQIDTIEMDTQHGCNDVYVAYFYIYFDLIEIKDLKHYISVIKKDYKSRYDKTNVRLLNVLKKLLISYNTPLILSDLKDTVNVLSDTNIEYIVFHKISSELKKYITSNEEFINEYFGDKHEQQRC